MKKHFKTIIILCLSLSVIAAVVIFYTTIPKGSQDEIPSVNDSISETPPGPPDEPIIIYTGNELPENTISEIKWDPELDYLGKFYFDTNNEPFFYLYTLPRYSMTYTASVFKVGISKDSKTELPPPDNINTTNLEKEPFYDFFQAMPASDDSTIFYCRDIMGKLHTFIKLSKDRETLYSLNLSNISGMENFFNSFSMSYSFSEDENGNLIIGKTEMVGNSEFSYNICVVDPLENKMISQTEISYSDYKWAETSGGKVYLCSGTKSDILVYDLSSGSLTSKFNVFAKDVKVVDGTIYYLNDSGIFKIKEDNPVLLFDSKNYEYLASGYNFITDGINFYVFSNTYGNFDGTEAKGVFSKYTIQ